MKKILVALNVFQSTMGKINRDCRPDLETKSRSGFKNHLEPDKKLGLGFKQHPDPDEKSGLSLLFSNSSTLLGLVLHENRQQVFDCDKGRLLGTLSIHPLAIDLGPSRLTEIRA